MRPVLLALLLLSGISPAMAHSWYPRSCCGGGDADGDCRPVDCSSIKPTSDGWIWNGVEFPRRTLHPSEDGGCHVCVLPHTSPGGICIFLRPET